jgi:hypothetical protein
MTSAARAGWGLLAVLAAAAAGAWAVGALPVANPWVSLRRRSRKTGRRQRVFIDDDGRIVKGLPAKYRGILLADLTQVGREVSKTKRRQRRELARLFPRSKTTFRNKDQAFKELMSANPQLRAFLDAHFGRDDERWLRWHRNGRRGRKPTTSYADGRLDTINQTWELEGHREADTWTEAIYATIPSSGRWEDFRGRIEILEDATGLSLELPAPAARLEEAGADRERYAEGAEGEIDDVYDRARDAATMQIAGEPDEHDELEAAPF